MSSLVQNNTDNNNNLPVIQPACSKTKAMRKAYIEKHPFPSYEEMRKAVKKSHNQFISSMRSSYTQECHDLVKKVYDSAGVDHELNRQVGEEIDEMGGFDLMQSCYDLLYLLTPVNEETSQDNVIANTFGILRRDWDGIGEWTN